MTDNKLTDNEIIQALSDLVKSTERIKHGGTKKVIVGAEFLKDMLNFINRQQAKIERLRGLLDGWKTEAYKVADEKDKLYCEAVERVKTVKSEAVAEFGKFLIDKAENGVIDVTNIPEYVIEKVGEQNV